MRNFQARAESGLLADLLAEENAARFDEWIYGRDVLDLVQEFGGVVDSAGTLAGLLPALQPRLYSIASSLKAHPEEVHLTMATVRYDAHGRARGGVASTHFADRVQPGLPVGVYPSPNRRFRLPENADTPIVMIGPGTGVAPFRSFLEERRETGAKGPAWLFFGERREATDFLYRDEIEAFRADGTLTRCDAAFSRDGPDKVYVQTLMAAHGAELFRWIEDGASIYVCGDAKRMARDVDAALVRIIGLHANLADEDARQRVEKLVADKRYLKDVY